MRALLVSVTSFVAGLCVIAAGAAAFNAPGPAQSRTATMPYAECLAVIEEAAHDERLEPVLTVNTAERREVRIAADDGFVTIACHRRENRLVLTGTVRTGDAFASAR